MLRFTKAFPATIQAGDYTLDIEVGRLNKSQLEELDANFDRLVVQRGALDPDALKAWNKEVSAERYTFFEDTIEKYVTVCPGQIEDDGKAVTTGQDVMRLFHGRRDILRDLVASVITQNHLIEPLRKNSTSPRASEDGSDSKIPARGGDAQGSTAGNAASSASANREDAMDASASTDADSGSPSSDSTDAETAKVH